MIATLNPPKGKADPARPRVVDGSLPEPKSFSSPTPPPTPYRWSLTEYRNLYGTHFLEGVRSYLIRGEIYTMPLPNPRHNTFLGIAHERFQKVFTEGFHVRNQTAFDLGTDTDLGPDLAVVAGSFSDYIDKQVTSAALIVEVSDSTLFFDTTTKAELYATAGVPEYWVLDIEKCELIVYREPEILPKGLGATAYRKRFILTAGETISPLAAPNSAIPIQDFLPKVTSSPSPPPT